MERYRLLLSSRSDVASSKISCAVPRPLYTVLCHAKQVKRINTKHIPVHIVSFTSLSCKALWVCIVKRSKLKLETDFSMTVEIKLTWSSSCSFTAFIQSDTILEVLHFGEGSLLQVRFCIICHLFIIGDIYTQTEMHVGYWFTTCNLIPLALTVTFLMMTFCISCFPAGGIWHRF